MKIHFLFLLSIVLISCSVDKPDAIGWAGIDKNPAEFEKIKQCKDYKPGILFVCDK